MAAQPDVRISPVSALGDTPILTTTVFEGKKLLAWAYISIKTLQSLPPYLNPDTPTPTATTKKIFTHTLPALSPLLPLAASHPNHPFTHSGVLVSSDRLHSIKHHVSANHEPWASAYDSMLSHPLGSTTRKPSPVATVVCGPTSTPNIG
ncbi:hypothetical protein FQN53_003271 [Emmonsiellopsis sp. PD_33]|nr:hypothetical protein FQN53_003271 [Emmonsiellopsis sp. PD_33]